MKKIYLIIAGAFLIILVITSMLLSLGKKSSTSTKNSLFPTSIPRDSTSQSINQQSNPQNNQLTLIPPIKNAGGNQGLSDSTDLNISAITPVETEDFKLQYSPKLNKVIVEKKTLQAEEQFINWAKQNQLTLLVNNADLTLIVDQGKNPDDFNPLIDFLNIFMNMGQGNQQSNNGTIEQSLIPSSLAPNGLTPNPSMTYFAQCGDQGSLPLPDGGTLCSAGCGPTTVAMISSSYVDKKYDPKVIVNLYKSNDYLLGNDGSRYSDAHELLKSLGLKTTDYLVFDLEKADTVVPQLRKYLSAGWTFFTLASFCEKGCGHYFWITDIDDKGNIWAYDPAYGRYKIPYNENSRYPYPLYRLAFGVKK